MIALELALCMLVAAFFAGLETGLLAANRMVVEEKARRGSLSARGALFLLSRPQRLLGTTLIGCNLGNVSASVLFTSYLIRVGWGRVAWLGILVMTFVFLVFDDLLPKSFFRQHADTAAIRLSPLLVAFFFLFMPLYAVLNAIIQAVLFVTRQSVSRREEVRSRRDLDFMLNLVGREVGLSRADRRLLNDILHFRDQRALEVMTPLHRLAVVSVDGSVSEAARQAALARQPFVPVVEQRYDDVVGYIDAVLLLGEKASSLRAIMKPAAFYPETVRIPELLRELNSRFLEVAFLADEFGGVAGMITPQQIVGDLFRFVPREGRRTGAIEQIEPSLYRVSGTADLEDFSGEVGVPLSRGASTTVGGYLCERLGRIPPVGTEYSERGLVFTVREADNRHVLTLDVRRDPQQRRERP